MKKAFAILLSLTLCIGAYAGGRSEGLDSVAATGERYAPNLYYYFMKYSQVLDENRPATTTEVVEEVVVAKPKRVKVKTPTEVSFGWGADLTGGINMNGQDMSNIGIDAYFGLRTAKVIRFAGVGAGINVPVSNSRRSYPLFGIFRTNFAAKPTPLFSDIRAGISINYTPADTRQTGFFLSAGLGYTLAHGKKFSSHIILSYEFTPMRDYHVVSADDPETPVLVHVADLHFATLRLGVTF